MTNLKKYTALPAALLGAAAMTFSAIAAPAMAAEGEKDSPWLVRVRGLAVVPDEGADVNPLGGTVEIDEDYVPEVDISYFFTDNIAAELILATTRHDVTWKGAGSLDLGKVSLLPPTLTLQYHFLPKETYRPYVGAGVNYTVFFNEDAPGGAITSADYDNAFGWALQAGMDIDLGNKWVANIDVKKIFLNTDVSLNGGAVTADVDIDPWLFGLGVGYRF